MGFFPGNLKDIIDQAKNMQSNMKEIKEEMEKKEFIGASGGNLVTVVMNGTGQVKKINIDSSLLENNDKEMLEDLLASAFNNGVEKAKDAVKDEVSKLIPIPGLF